MSKCLETFDYAFQLYPSPRAKAMETKLISSDNLTSKIIQQIKKFKPCMLL